MTNQRARGPDAVGLSNAQREKVLDSRTHAESVPVRRCAFSV